MMPTQLPLPLNWPDYANFDNFYVGDNLHAVTYLKKLCENLNTCATQQFVAAVEFGCVYLYGPQGVGLTHLLQACCQKVSELGGSAGYLSLARKNLSPIALEGLETFSLFCLDDLDAVMGDSVWEEALFYTYNRAKSAGTTLIISAHLPPHQLSCVLPDLKSRLLASMIFQIQSLSDQEKIKALQLRAQKRGFDLSDEVGHYLLLHYPRNMKALFSFLEKLDYVSLAEQRKITIPFVKKIA